MSEQFPCYNCPHRKITCHDYCEEYLAVREALAEEKGKRKGLYDAISLLVEATDKSKRRRNLK